MTSVASPNHQLRIDNDFESISQPDMKPGGKIMISEAFPNKELELNHDF